MILNKRYFIVYLLIFLLLLSPGVVAFIIEKFPAEIIFLFLFEGGLLLLPTVFFHRNLHLYFYILTVLAVFAPLALIPLVFFKIEVNIDIITLVINTSFREAWELFGKLFIPFILIFVAYITLYIFLVRKSVKAVSLKKGMVMSAMGVILFLSGVLIKSGTKDFGGNLKTGLFSYYPNSIVYNVFKYSRKLTRVNHEALTKNFTFSAHKGDTLKNKEIYVLVIGETSRAHNWGLYGYSRNTSPRLDKRAGLLPFTDASTAGAMTELSVPLIITRATPDDYDRHFREKAVGAAFDESGFRTYWISNQDDYFHILMHKKEMDSVINLGASRSSAQTVYDISVVNEFEKILMNNSSDKTFFILHTMGSHFNYAMRYPESYDVFKPSARHKAINPMNPSNKEIMVNSYDNSILYTDMILDSLITLLDQQNAVSYLLYLSDHGEDLYDDSRMKFLHPPTMPSAFVAHIPFFIWTSPQYDATYPQKYRVLKSHLNNPISSHNVFETLLDMADITYPGQNLTESIASDSFHNSKQWLLGGDMKVYRYKDLK